MKATVRRLRRVDPGRWHVQDCVARGTVPATFVLGRSAEHLAVSPQRPRLIYDGLDSARRDDPWRRTSSTIRELRRANDTGEFVTAAAGGKSQSGLQQTSAFSTHQPKRPTAEAGQHLGAGHTVELVALPPAPTPLAGRTRGSAVRRGPSPDSRWSPPCGGSSARIDVGPRRDGGAPFVLLGVGCDRGYLIITEPSTSTRAHLVPVLQGAGLRSLRLPMTVTVMVCWPGGRASRDQATRAGCTVGE
jgi:hypothetical protein